MGFLSGLLSVAAPIVGTAIGGPLGGAIGAGIGAAGNAFGASENNKNQQNLLKQQIEAQQQLQKDQNDWNEQMWNKQNEYNSPANQRQLYEEAGLNPAYFFGKGQSAAGSVNSTAMSAPSVPTPAGNFQGLGNIGDVASLALLESQIKVNESKAGLNDAQKETEDKIRAAKVEYQDLLNNLTKSQTDVANETVNKIKADTDYLKVLKGKTQSEKDQIDLIIAFLPFLQQAQLDEIRAHIRELESRADLNDEQKAYVKFFAKGAYLAGLGSYKSGVAAEENAETNRMIAPSTIRKNDAEAKFYNTGAGVNEANEEGKKIQNDIDEKTAGSKKFKEITQNYVGTVIGLMGNLLDNAGKAAGIVGNFFGFGKIGKIAKGAGSTKNPSAPGYVSSWE